MNCVLIYIYCFVKIISLYLVVFGGIYKDFDEYGKEIFHIEYFY